MASYAPVRPVRGLRFSRVELTHILVAVVALTIAFTFSLAGGYSYFLQYLDLGLGFILGLLAISSLIAVLTAFLFHELAHKVVAQRYGCFAEFRYYPMGLAIGVLTGLFGFLFAAPGAVMIAGPVGPRENVRISAAGPATNLGFGAAFLGLAVAFGFSGTLTGGLLGVLVSTVAFVNVFLAGFNLIPFPPLDGSKIFAFDKVLWVVMVVATVGLLAAGAYLGVFLL